MRRLLRSAIRRRSDLEVIGEAEDGLDAVQLTSALRPDVILLDIGLPRLDGIAAAERIRHFAPATTLVFVSEHASAEVVQAAFRAGGRGYVHKSHLRRDLLPAVAAVLQGQYFVSRGWEHGEGRTGLARHDVQFYSDDAVFFDSANRFLGPAVGAGRGVIVLATPSHRDGVVQRLRSDGVDIDAAIQHGTYCSIDASEALSDVMSQGVPDCYRLRRHLSNLIGSVSHAVETDEPRVVILGEGAGLLCAEGSADAAISLEQMANELLVICDIDILCTYPLHCRQPHDAAFRRICAEHGGVNVR